MLEIGSARWGEMVAAYEAADAAAEGAGQAFDGAPTERRLELKATWSEIMRRRDALRSALLSCEAPSIEAAAYQLRLFAKACRFPDPAGPPPTDDDQAGVLHRIYAGLGKLAAARLPM